VLNISRDSSGRVSSLYDQYRTYISNITHNPAGKVTALSLGNVANESYGYDGNRLQLTSQTATAVGGPTNGLMNLTYNYQASAGQMGAGTTAGNAGQLMSISGTINSTTESAAYTYDNLGRLMTSDQTSNAATAQRRFAYDRWGNRIGMWDATNGGNQLQGITLQQSGGAPTNQIASVIVGLNIKNYSHDYAGNITNDGVHTYQYDAENRLTSVDGGATASYAYDQHNRRIKKVVGSTTTHYVWEGSQVIAEHDGSTGGVIYNYVYSGSRMIARMGSGVINWYLSDRLSERLVLDANGSVIGRMAHLPFGEDFGETGTQEKHHFNSYDRDSESTTDYVVNRQYSASIGRFMRTDPLPGKASGPQSLNRYSYVGNEPIGLFDPDGRVTVCKIVGFGTIWQSAGGDGWALVGSFTIFSCGEIDPLTNDTGRGSGGGGDRKPRADLSKKKSQAITNAFSGLATLLQTPSQKCQTNVIDKLKNSPLNFDLNSFLGYLANGAQFFDGTQSDASIAGTITSAQAAANAPFAPCTTVSCLFARTNENRRVNALTSITSGTLLVFLRPDAISTDNSGLNSQNYSLLFHEALHGYGGSLGGTSYFDSDIMQALGISNTQPSSAISAYIKQNCFN